MKFLWREAQMLHWFACGLWLLIYAAASPTEGSCSATSSLSSTLPAAAFATQRWLDISLPLQDDMPLWESKEGLPSVKKPLSTDEGDLMNVSEFENLSVHTLTHVDAFKHFAPAGGPHNKRAEGVADDIERMPLDIFNGLAYVVEVPNDIPVITREVLEKLEIPMTAERVLFKTRNTENGISFKKAFDEEYVALDDSGAQWAGDHPSMKLLGIDYLSIASYSDLVTAHQILLGNGVAALEGLDLSKIEPGAYNLLCLPLKIPGADGSPVRAVLIPVS